jgi:hypothetical protein
MVEETPHPDGRPEHPEIKTEPSDVSFTAVAVVLGTLAVLAVLIHVVLWGFFRKQEQHESAVKRSPFPLAAQPSGSLPPEPRLEPLDRTSGVETSNVFLRLEEKEAATRRYGPTPEEGYVHIPVGRAMDLLAGKLKLPARAAPPADAERKAGGLTDSGESNSGRMYREGPRWWSER